MSYFGRLVEQSHLMVAGAAADSRDVRRGDPVAAGAIDSGGVMNGDAVDLIEINEVVEAPPMPRPAARQEVPERAPSSPIENDAFVIARTNSVVEVPSAATERDRAVERVDARLVPASSEPSRTHEPSTPREGSTYDIAMRRVLEWVAAGPRPDVTSPVPVANQPSIEERRVDSVATARPPEPSRDDEPAMVETIVAAAAREIPTRAIGLATRAEQAATSLAPDPRSPSVSQRAASANASVVEDVVQVSIGSISVRIEAPPPPTPTVIAPPPRSAAPAPREAQAPERGTRLARRYLHP